YMPVTRVMVSVDCSSKPSAKCSNSSFSSLMGQ
ncbi:MAG: hypothetical protein ACI9V9_000911, partial [Oleispira sp.]